jgi:hypothetical protein
MQGSSAHWSLSEEIWQKNGPSLSPQVACLHLPLPGIEMQVK